MCRAARDARKRYVAIQLVAGFGCMLARPDGRFHSTVFADWSGYMNRPADKPTVAVSSRRIAVPAAYHPKETRVEGTRRRSMSAASRVATPPVYRPTVAKRHSAPPAPPQATASRAASAQRVASGRAGEPRAGVALPQAGRPNHGSATVQAGAPVRPKVPPVYRPGRQHGVLLPARVMKGASGWQNSSHSKLPAVRRHPIAIQRMI